MKRYNNKILIFALVGLVAAFVLARMFRTPKLESNMRKKLITIDTVAITEIRIVRAQQTEEIKITYKDNAWKVATADREASVDEEEVKSALRMVSDIKILRMVSRKKEKWDAFNVSDSSAIKVSLYAGNDKQADLRIGTIGFSQNRDMYTYVRLADEDEVYSTKEFLNISFNKKFDDWRNKALIRLSKEEITKVSFNYPDSSFVLEKKDSLWYVDDQSIKIDKAETYLSKLKYQDMTDFNDTFTPTDTLLPLTIQISNSKETLTTLKAWSIDKEVWVLSSSLQKDIYFTDSDGKTIKDLFVGQTTFSD